MRRAILALLCLVLPPAAHAQQPAPAFPLFSANNPGDALPAGWTAVFINARKKPTRYDLVDDRGVVVLHALADASASLVGREVAIDIGATPFAHWRWKTARLIPGADNTERDSEDAPVRVIFEFAGDRNKLPVTDQATFRLSKIATGREPAYASLMYIWSGNEPVNMRLDDPFTRRIKIIVASSGPLRLNQWQDITRNLRDDFRLAFGEMPGKLVSVSVMTDTDNTGGSAESWYGDITLSASPR